MLGGNDTSALNALEQGADPNCSTRIYSGVFNWRYSIPELFDGGLRAVHGKDRTILMAAVLKSWPRLVKALIAHGGLVNATDRDGNTALILAVRYIFQPESIKLLLDGGADVDAKTVWGDSVLSITISQTGSGTRTAAILRLLLAHERWSHPRDKDFNMVLNWCVIHGCTDIVKLVLTHDGDIDGRDAGDRTPVINAVITENSDLLRLLLEHHPDLTLKDNLGRTPLAQATLSRNEAIIQMLQNAGAKE
jgi:ankyrin repeat protein